MLRTSQKQIKYFKLYIETKTLLYFNNESIFVYLLDKKNSEN